jgi:cellulose biosynthesis protein BcsQ
MSAKVVYFASAKGGAGKTVVAATIGAFLAALGKRVLLIDADAATNGLTLLYIKEVLAQAGQLPSEQQPPLGLFEGDEAAAKVSHVQILQGVDIVPATYQFVNTEGRAPGLFQERLALTLNRCRKDYDYIFLDAQAGADVYASIAMNKKTSDVVVLVSEYDPMSAAGIERLKGLMRDDLTYARTWVLLNKILPEFAKNFSDFLEVARYLSPIPWDADVVRAYARSSLALDTENGNSFTLAVMQTVRSLFGEEIESDIKNWTKTRAEAIRQPIQAQYSDLERELAAIMQASAREQFARRTREVWQRMTLVVLGAATAATLGLRFGLFERVSWLAIVEVAVVIVALGSVFSLFRGLGISSVKADIERAKIERRREVVETTLRKLEALRAAEPESLLRERKGV